MITKKKLCAIKGLSEAKVEKMKEAVLKICGSNAGFCTALQHSLNRRNVFRVGTGSQVSHNMFFSVNLHFIAYCLHFFRS